MSERVTEIHKANVPFLLYVCLVSTLGGLLWGFDAIVISGTIEQVKELFTLSSGMEGLFVSSALIGAVLGAASAGFLSDRFGRSRNLIFSAVLLLVSAAGSGFAWNISSLIIARAIGGIGVGIAAMVCPLYISEISPAHLRGRMVTLFQFAICTGILIALLSNAGLYALAARMGEMQGSVFWKWFLIDQTWRSMFSAELIPGILFLLLSFTLPESPRWLVKTGQTEKARSLLRRILKSGADQVASSIQETIQQEAKEVPRYRDVFKPQYRKPLIIAILLSVFAQFSGINVVFYYGPSVLEQAGFEMSGALGGFATIGFFNAIFTLVAFWVVDKLGRRPLMIIGTLGAIISLCGIGLFLNSGKTTLLIGFICAFVAFFAISLGPIKFVFASEIFPTNIRAHAVSIAILAMWAADTLVGLLFPLLRDAFGASMTFYFFAATLIPQIWMVWMYMPETAGRSLEEIEKWWHKNKSI